MNRFAVMVSRSRSRGHGASCSSGPRTRWPPARSGERWRWPARPPGFRTASNQNPPTGSRTCRKSCSRPISVQTMSPGPRLYRSSSISITARPSKMNQYSSQSWKCRSNVWPGWMWNVPVDVTSDQAGRASPSMRFQTFCPLVASSIRSAPRRDDARRKGRALGQVAQDRLGPAGVVDRDEAHGLPAGVLGAVVDAGRDVRRVARPDVAVHRVAGVVLDHLATLAGDVVEDLLGAGMVVAQVALARLQDHQPHRDARAGDPRLGQPLDRAPVELHGLDVGRRHEALVPDVRLGNHSRILQWSFGGHT